jgi:hypothetical protein
MLTQTASPSWLKSELEQQQLLKDRSTEGPKQAPLGEHLEQEQRRNDKSDTEAKQQALLAQRPHDVRRKTDLIQRPNSELLAEHRARSAANKSE